MTTVHQGKQVAAVRFGRLDAGLDEVEHAIDASRELLFQQQHPDGYWCGELEADTTLESDYIMLHTLLGTGNEGRMRRAITEILRHQNEDGGWSIYAGGPSNISATVKAYFALKLMGWSASDPLLMKVRDWILANGGATEVNTYTKLYLCFFGQYDYNAVPAIPPEIVLFPRWFYFNLYEISSWSRAILVPRKECSGKSSSCCLCRSWPSRRCGIAWRRSSRWRAGRRRTDTARADCRPY